MGEYLKILTMATIEMHQELSLVRICVVYSGDLLELSIQQIFILFLWIDGKENRFSIKDIQYL